MDTYTDDERAFLVGCERDFANRYTETDYDYMLHIKIGMSSPPCVEPWYPKEENRSDQQRRNGGSPQTEKRKRRD